MHIPREQCFLMSPWTSIQEPPCLNCGVSLSTVTTARGWWVESPRHRRRRRRRRRRPMLYLPRLRPARRQHRLRATSPVHARHHYIHPSRAERKKENRQTQTRDGGGGPSRASFFLFACKILFTCGLTTVLLDS